MTKNPSITAAVYISLTKETIEAMGKLVLQILENKSPPEVRIEAFKTLRACTPATDIEHCTFNMTDKAKAVSLTRN